MLRLPQLLRRVVSQDVALRNAAIATAGLRERRRMKDDVDAYLTHRARERSARAHRAAQ